MKYYETSWVPNRTCLSFSLKPTTRDFIKYEFWSHCLLICLNKLKDVEGYKKWKKKKNWNSSTDNMLDYQSLGAGDWTLGHVNQSLRPCILIYMVWQIFILTDTSYDARVTEQYERILSEIYCSLLSG